MSTTPTCDARARNSRVLAKQLIELGARLAKAAISYRFAAIAALHAPDTDDTAF